MSRLTDVVAKQWGPFVEQIDNDPWRTDFETACLADETLGPLCLARPATRLVVTRSNEWHYVPWNDSEVVRVMDDIRRQLKPSERFCVKNTYDVEGPSNRHDGIYYVYIEFGTLAPESGAAEN